ncbi:MAG: glycerophosphodiester phosphodiesterase [Ruminococcaceae bacterium]|nr:glycerophosphodiester phosphodiesterase [Oscillospiraceae bacterium]
MWFIFIFAIIFLVYLFLVFPRITNKAAGGRFANRSYAHRGLHDDLIPENSIESFLKANEHGYGFELDVRLTKDNEVVVFHDDDLVRACGIDKRIDEMMYEELKELKIFKTDKKIPLLSDVLKAADTRYPIIVELKTTTSAESREKLCGLTEKILNEYSGDYCIESFDPNIVGWFRKNSPKTVRGQLAMSASSYSGETTRTIAFLLGNLLTNFISRPDFIAYKWNEKGFSLAVNRLLGATVFNWTVTDAEVHKNLIKKGESVIFEGYVL